MDKTKGGNYRREFEVIRTIAETMRAGFGNSIDAHPGGTGSEAGAINQAFRLAASVILNEAGLLEDESGVRTWVLRQVALGRLLEAGVIGAPADALLDLEPDLGDAWLAYVALATESVVVDLLEYSVGGEDSVVNQNPA